jgi:ABC-type cobalamin/Fe3+-siderophores transport system ATPase subunit
MLKKLLLGFGRTPEDLELDCPVGTITVFVGPNNSGKSQALHDIERQLRGPFMLNPIVEELEVVFPSAPLEEELLDKVVADLQKILEASEDGSDDKAADRSPGRTKDPWMRLMGRRRLDIIAFKALPENQNRAPEAEDFAESFRATLRRIRAKVQEHAAQGSLRALAREWISQGVIRLVGYASVLSRFCVKLDGSTRLLLVRDTEAPDWRGQDKHAKPNHLVELLKHPKQLESLRRLVHREFRHYPVIDTTHPGKTVLKMASEEPGSHERSTSPEALAYFDAARPIEEFSDGVKSFVGLLAAILSGDHRIILIDEPEAFLHPPLARSLGTALYQLARGQQAQVLAATHSPDFLMGCVQAGPEVSIIRLTYKDGQPAARVLRPAQLQKVMRHPLLRSTGVLGALFHEGAIVCESDSDRAFYQEVNERLLAAGRGAHGCAFLNAQNKQTLHRIVAPLREMGVPAAAIIDLDVLSKGDELRRLLDAAQAQPSARESLIQAKDRFFKLFCAAVGGDEEEARRQMKREGVSLLSEGDCKALRTFLLDPLADHGIFVVPCGELESWLSMLAKGLGRSDKAKWLMQVFERMGDDPDHPTYARPGSDDVWAFMDRLAAWIVAPSSGMTPAS